MSGWYDKAELARRNGTSGKVKRSLKLKSEGEWEGKE